jgi:hypothetical protein
MNEKRSTGKQLRRRGHAGRKGFWHAWPTERMTRAEEIERVIDEAKIEISRAIHKVFEPAS